MKLVAVFLCALLSFGAASAWAQANVDAEQCRTISSNPDLAIKHCTRAIETGKLPAGELAVLYVSRGVEWERKNDYDRAIADHSAAIKLDPKLADAYHNRGSAWANKGEPDRAISDFDAALRLEPKNADVFHARGVEWTVKGDYARALSDFDNAVQLNPSTAAVFFPRGRTLFYRGDYAQAVDVLAKAHDASPSNYSALWLYLARRRAGAANADEMLERDTRTTRSQTWPIPILALYAGQTDPDSVMGASADRDSARSREQRCEANFYIAHWHLMKGAAERALPLLAEAQKTCPKNGLEYEGTLAELRKLKPR